jgi:rhodanese-related sulfurtransferase
METDHMERMTAEKFALEVEAHHPEIYDIRRETEYETEHLEDAQSKPLAYINDWIKDINPNKHFFMHCASGYRTMIASSILRARGYRNFTEIEGGINAVRKTGLPKDKFVHTTKV